MKIAEAFPLMGLSYHDLEHENRRLKRANRKLKKTIQRLVEEKDDCAEFVLSNPKPKPWQGDEPANTRQTLLLSGLDCLPCQQDLFHIRKIDPSCRARAGRRGTPIARVLLS